MWKRDRDREREREETEKINNKQGKDIWPVAVCFVPWSHSWTLLHVTIWATWANDFNGRDDNLCWRGLNNVAIRLSCLYSRCSLFDVIRWLTTTPRTKARLEHRLSTLASHLRIDAAIFQTFQDTFFVTERSVDDLLILERRMLSRRTIDRLGRYRHRWILVEWWSNGCLRDGRNLSLVRQWPCIRLNCGNGYEQRRWSSNHSIARHEIRGRLERLGPRQNHWYTSVQERSEDYFTSSTNRFWRFSTSICIGAVWRRTKADSRTKPSDEIRSLQLLSG